MHFRGNCRNFHLHHFQRNYQISNVIIYINASVYFIKVWQLRTSVEKRIVQLADSIIYNSHTPPRHCGSFIYCAQQLQALIAVIWLASPYPCNESLDLYPNIRASIAFFQTQQIYFQVVDSGKLTAGFFLRFSDSIRVQRKKNQCVQPPTAIFPCLRFPDAFKQRERVGLSSYNSTFTAKCLVKPVYLHNHNETLKFWKRLKSLKFVLYVIS